jgi:hypothetical protein
VGNNGIGFDHWLRYWWRYYWPLCGSVGLHQMMLEYEAKCCILIAVVWFGLMGYGLSLISGN